MRPPKPFRRPQILSVLLVTKRLSIPIALILLFTARPLQADQSPHTLEWSHATNNADQLLNADLKSGDELVVLVIDTCPDSFTIELHSEAIPTPPKSDRADRTASPFCSTGDLAPLRTKYDTKFGGYVVTVRHLPTRPRIQVKWASTETQKQQEPKLLEAVTPPCKSDVSSAICAAAVKEQWKADWGSIVALNDAVLTIVVAPADPVIFDFASGLTISWLTNPQFHLVDHNDSNPMGRYEIVEDRQNEDAVRPGLAAFLHTSFRGFLGGVPAITMGTGVNTGGQASYFFGLSARLAGKAFLTLGYNIGQLQYLPGGLTTTSRTNNVNVLTSLPTRTSGAFFVALSYSIFGNAQAELTKLFQPIGANTSGK